MAKRFTIFIIGSTAALTLSSVMRAQNQPWNNAGLAQSPNQQQQTGPPAAPAPRRDLSGIWDAGGAGIGARGYMTAPLTPWGEALGKTHKSGDGARMVPVEEINDPLSTMGDPEGFPRNLLFELRPFQIVQTPNQVLMLYMFEKRWRVIWTDGRQLPKDPNPTWMGYSVGHWEKDTLVVESNGFNGKAWLSFQGNPITDALHVTERIRRRDFGHMDIQITIDDPKAYTKPWTAELHPELIPDMELLEFVCNENERDLRHLVGK